MKCPNCGYCIIGNEPSLTCEVSGCIQEAVYEGWYARRDPLTCEKTGLIQRRKVCEEHKHLLGLLGDEERKAGA